MDDLISRAAAIDAISDLIKEYRDDGKDEMADGMIIVRRYVIRRLPAVDAVPVEWLNKRRDRETLLLFSNIYGNGDKDIVRSIHKVLELWRKDSSEDVKNNG